MANGGGGGGGGGEGGEDGDFKNMVVTHPFNTKLSDPALNEG